MSTAITGLIFDIKRFSIHDGPGIRTTIFLKGCLLHCAWCHNPEGISPLPEIHFWEKRCIGCYECAEACSTGALTWQDGKRIYQPGLCLGCGDCAQACPAEAIDLVGNQMTVSTLLAEIEKDNLYYDQSGGGVTFSGGEPLLQIDFLESILKACWDRGIHTAIDTSGQAAFDAFNRILPYANLFLYDLKLIDSERHLQYTGLPNHRILQNLVLLAQNGANIIPRIPIIPGINDDAMNIRETGAFIQSLEGIEQIHILPYHRTAVDKYQRMGNPYTLIEVKPPASESMQEIACQLEGFGFKVVIGG